MFINFVNIFLNINLILGVLLKNWYYVFIFSVIFICYSFLEYNLVMYSMIYKDINIILLILFL